MMKDVARLHIRALSHTWSSRQGEKFVRILYEIVKRFGFIRTAYREGEMVGVVSGISNLILTLVVAPQWQRRGIGSELVHGLTGKRYVYTEKCSVEFYKKMGFERIIQVGRTIFLCRKS